MKAAEVLLKLVHDDLRLAPDYSLELIEHEVGENWRQRFATPRAQIGALQESLVHVGPFSGRRLRVADLAATVRAGFTTASLATSLTSRVWDDRGRLAGHLALMNLHPVGFHDQEELRRALDDVVGGRAGYLLASGRHLHYYGRWLLSTADWRRFLAQFLMPCVLVSPRYVGHSLYRGFCSLRLNAVPPFKPTVPSLLGPS